jgi:uncharacterized protein GlcG (DUF336 family)
MNALTLELANRIIAAALSKSAEMSLRPLVVAGLDSGGYLVAFQKQDSSSKLRFEIASGKASGALAVGAGSGWLQDAARRIDCTSSRPC